MDDVDQLALVATALLVAALLVSNFYQCRSSTHGLMPLPNGTNEGLLGTQDSYRLVERTVSYF